MALLTCPVSDVAHALQVGDGAGDLQHAVIRRANSLSRMMAVRMDANLITAAVGRRADGSAARRLTAAQDAIRRRMAPHAFQALNDDSWGIHADYTDSIASPAQWLGRDRRRLLAASVELSAEQARRWVRDPDAFLQEGVDPKDEDSLRWWEHPAMRHALNEAWFRHLHALHTAPRKALAIRIAFRCHPAAGQMRVPITGSSL